MPSSNAIPSTFYFLALFLIFALPHLLLLSGDIKLYMFVYSIFCTPPPDPRMVSSVR